MTTNFHFHLPNWGAERLVREAVCSWGLRHLSEGHVDYETAPWPEIRQQIFAYLRHNHSDYDDRLRTRCEHDPGFRDQMATEIAAAAYRKYPWLREDPRPFPESEDSVLPLDRISRDLADLHTYRNHVTSAIRDLRRQGNHRKEIAELEASLAQTRAEIDACYGFLSVPKFLPDENKTRTLVLVRPPVDGIDPNYYFCCDKSFAPYRIEYTGFRCPRCDAAVARWKTIVEVGQGYRCVVYSCYCQTTATHTPTGYARVMRMTLERWVGCHDRTSNAPEK